GVVWPVAVSPPVAFHLSGIGVDHRYALVEIAVCDVGLVRFRIDPDLGNTPEILEIVAAGILAGAANLQQELAVLGEFEKVRILLAVASDPNIAFVIHVDPMVELRSFLAVHWTASGAHKASVRIEY